MVFYGDVLASLQAQESRPPIFWSRAGLPADQDHHRDACCIYNDVSLGAEFASVRGVGDPFPGPRGAWYRGAINAASAPIDLVMFTQASQHD